MYFNKNLSCKNENNKQNKPKKVYIKYSKNVVQVRFT